MRRRALLVWVAVALAAGLGCVFHRGVRKSPYQIALESYSAATTPEELERALETLNAAVKRHPADAQLRLLRASALLRKVRQQRLRRDAWQAGGPAGVLMEDLRRVTALVDEEAAGTAWMAARAYIIAADLALTRAQSDTFDPAPPAEPGQRPLSRLGVELQARALRQVAREWYAGAYRIAEAALATAQPQQIGVLKAQRDHALEGFLAAEAHLAVSEANLGLSVGQPSALMKAREAVLQGRLPESAKGTIAPLSLEPAVYDRDWRVLRAIRAETQQEWLHWRELAFREQVAASLLEDPGRVRLFGEDLLEDVVSSLAATRLRWRLSAPVAGGELRIRIERHPWFKEYAAPVINFALYIGERQVLAVNTQQGRAAEGGPGPPVFVPPEGVTLVLDPGEPPEAPPAGGEVHLYLGVGGRFEFLDEKGARLRLVDGFGRVVASVSIGADQGR